MPIEADLLACERVEPEKVLDWTVVHARIAELAAERASREREVCRWLLAAERLGIASRSGLGDIYQYANHTLGLSRRQTEERLRVGRALKSLPQLDDALARGEFCFTAVRELTRVATRETEGEWHRFARGTSTREIQVAVAERHAGDRPTDRPDPSLRKHRLSFEVSAETIAMFRDLQTAVRAELGGSPSDDQVLLEIARRGLGGPSDAGRASYQVAVSRCDTCKLARIDAGGESHPVDEATVERMECDAQHIPPICQHACRGPELARAGVACGSADRQSAAAHEVDRPRARAEETAPGETAPAETAPAETAPAETAPAETAPAETAPAETAPAETAPAETAPEARPRTSQSIPLATRRHVMFRDSHRCVVPGCHNHRYLDVHHIVPRSEGGGHHADNLTVLCGSHHDAVHRGTLILDRSASAETPPDDNAPSRGLTFRHADGTIYGEPLRPAAIELATQVFDALRNLGVGATRARQLVDIVQRNEQHTQLDPFLRAALRAM